MAADQSSALSDYTPRGRSNTPAPNPVQVAVHAYEPPPALVTEVAAPAALVNGAWTEIVRKVLGLRISRGDSRAVFVIKKGELDKACEVFAEKRIPPAGWLAWRAAKLFAGKAQKPPALGMLLGLPWLQDARKRGWYRSETAGLYGGRSVVVGDPPTSRDPMAVEAYREYAVDEAVRLADAWKKRVQHGAIFINASVPDFITRMQFKGQ